MKSAAPGAVTGLIDSLIHIVFEAAAKPLSSLHEEEGSCTKNQTNGAGGSSHIWKGSGRYVAAALNKRDCVPTQSRRAWEARTPRGISSAVGAFLASLHYRFFHELI